MARHFAERVAAGSTDPAVQLTAAFRLALARTPSPAELAELVAYSDEIRPAECMPCDFESERVRVRRLSLKMKSTAGKFTTEDAEARRWAVCNSIGSSLRPSVSSAVRILLTSNRQRMILNKPTRGCRDRF